MTAVIIIGIILLIIFISVSSSNKKQREEAERLTKFRQQKEETERLAKLKREKEEKEKKEIEEKELKRLDEINNETIVVVYESINENNKPKAIVKRSNNTYASFERQGERFEVSEKIKLAKETINKWNWFDETTYQNKLIILQQADLERDKALEEERKRNQFLDEFRIDYLYHMTHKNNLERILQTGLKSHNEARRNNLMQIDIANEDVNARRSRVDPIHNRNLHEYVPFYFNPKNSMLFVQNEQNNIVILAIEKRLIFDINSIFTDGNAANNSTKFFNDLCNLNQLNWSCIRAAYWNEFIDGRRKRMAEVLIYPDVPIKFIQKIYCNNYETLQFIQELTSKYQNIETEINRNLYF